MLILQTYEGRVVMPSHEEAQGAKRNLVDAIRDNPYLLRVWVDDTNTVVVEVEQPTDIPDEFDGVPVRMVVVPR